MIGRSCACCSGTRGELPWAGGHVFCLPVGARFCTKQQSQKAKKRVDTGCSGDVRCCVVISFIHCWICLFVWCLMVQPSSVDSELHECWGIMNAQILFLLSRSVRFIKPILSRPEAVRLAGWRCFRLIVMGHLREQKTLQLKNKYLSFSLAGLTERSQDSGNEF